ncbi:MAG: transcriptional regulator, GntR family [Chloroflexi bacterium]|nr:transcriptional regulator, GntR family [Chloroflexota bacterium]
MCVTPGTPTETFTPELFDEIFHLLRGYERAVVPTAVDHAYEMIWKQLIVSGGRGGQRLSDVTLAAQLGVSRTPVRQALYRLAEDGLVVSDPRRGFWMRTFTSRDVSEIYTLRSALEVLALRLAAPLLNPDDLAAQLELATELRYNPQAHSLALHLRSDVHMHNLLILGSANSRLIRALATIRSQHSMFQIRDSLFPSRVEAAAQDHQDILRALIAGSVDEAADLLAKHIERSATGVLEDLFADEDDQAG